MNCPACTGTVLSMSDRRGVEIAYCPQCRGVWLDRDELDKLLEHAATRHQSGDAEPRPDGQTEAQNDRQNQQSGDQEFWLTDIFDSAPTFNRNYPMRTYHRNSPHAAARIVTLAMFADGNLGHAELDLLDQQAIHAQLGLSETEFHGVTNAFCEDLLAQAHQAGFKSCRIDPATISGMLDEIDDPTLRLKVLRCCILLIDADQRVTNGESTVLLAALDQWGLRQQLLQAR